MSRKSELTHEERSPAETNSDKSSNSEGSESETSSDESCTEFVSNPFSRIKEVWVANSCDYYVWVGLDGDRKTDKGGEKYEFDIAGVFGAGFKSSKKEHQLISRIPWTRIQFHRYATCFRNVEHCSVFCIHYELT
jgi:hypothetical protein